MSAAGCDASPARPVPLTLPRELPPPRMLLVLNNPAGHQTPGRVLWIFANGIMPLYTPLAGSWLNLCELVRRIVKRRALECHTRRCLRRSSGCWK
jgi:hypothetical protein